MKKILPHTSAGFTMIEALITITLIGIVSAFAIPGLYGAYQRQQLLNTANEIVSTISQAKALAQANNQQGFAKSSDTPAKPYGPCDQPHPGIADYKYIDSYTVGFTTTAYDVKPGLRSGAGCDDVGATTSVAGSTLPNTVRIATAESTGVPLKFATTTGTMSFYGGVNKAKVVLASNGGVLSSVKYYVCITPEKTVVQPDDCP